MKEGSVYTEFKCGKGFLEPNGTELKQPQSILVLLSSSWPQDASLGSLSRTTTMGMIRAASLTLICWVEGV